MKSWIKPLLAITFASLITGCSLWRNSDEVRPAPLVDFTPESSVTTQWSVSIGRGTGEGFHQMQPSIDGDSIYAADDRGVVVALNRHTGERLWTVNLREPIIGGVGSGHGQVVLSTRTGYLVALNANDGAEIWRKRLSTEVTAPPQINRELVVVKQLNGKVIALDRMTGEQRWSFSSQVPALTLRGTGAPLLTADVTFAGLLDGRIVTLDNRNGQVIWDYRVALNEGRTDLERIVNVNSRPIILDDVLYVVGYQGRLLAINPFNVQALWSQTISSYRNLASGFGNIYVSDANSHVHAYDARTGASVWSQTELTHRRLTSPAALGNALVVGDSEGYLHFMSQVNGQFLARHRIDSSGLQSDMLVRDNTLYVHSNSGRLVALTLN